jgi:hypothetical protein
VSAFGPLSVELEELCVELEELCVELLTVVVVVVGATVAVTAPAEPAGMRFELLMVVGAVGVLPAASRAR